MAEIGGRLLGQCPVRFKELRSDIQERVAALFRQLRIEGVRLADDLAAGMIRTLLAGEHGGRGGAAD